MLNWRAQNTTNLHRFHYYMAKVRILTVSYNHVHCLRRWVNKNSVTVLRTKILLKYVKPRKAYPLQTSSQSGLPFFDLWNFSPANKYVRCVLLLSRVSGFSPHGQQLILIKFHNFDVFSTVHHSIELFHQPTLMHNFLFSLTIWPASWSGGQSFWLLTTRSRVRFPALPWEFFLVWGGSPWWPWSG